MGLFSVFRRTTPSSPAAPSMARDLHILGRQVQAAFLGQGLAVDLELRIQSARTITVILAPIHFGLAETTKVRRMEPVLEAALRLSPVRVSQEQGRIFVEFPSPRPAVLRGATPSFRLAGLQVGLGLTARNQVASLDLARDPHVLLVGPTRRGKSTAARSIVWHLIDQSTPSYDTGLRVIVVSGRPADWSGLDGATNVWGVVPPSDALAVARWVRAQVTHRERHGLTQPRLVLVVDDLLSQLIDEAELVAPLSGIASNGGAAGVHLVLCTQRLGKRGVGDAAISGNILTRVVVGAADAQEASLFTGRENSGAERLTGDGDVLLVTRRGVERVTVGQVTNEDLADLPRWRGPLVPWQPEPKIAPPVARSPLSLAVSPSPIPADRVVIQPVEAQNTPLLTVVPGGDSRDEAGTGGDDGDTAGTALSGPLLPRRPPTAEDAALLRKLYAEHGSNQTQRLAWGDKGGRFYKWLQMALAEVEDT